MKEGEEMRKKVLVLAVLVLALVFPFLTQVSAEENAYYVDPTIEFDAVQLNATAYRFYSGDTLNFTFTFTTQEGVLASYPENYTNCGKSKKSGHLYITTYLDGILTSYAHYGKGVEGSGWAYNRHIQTVRTAGNHTINYNWLFTIDDDAEGYLDINFLTEVKLKIEKLPTEPFPTESLLASGAIGASVATVIIAGLFFVNKRRNKPSKEATL